MSPNGLFTPGQWQTETRNFSIFFAIAWCECYNINQQFSSNNNFGLVFAWCELHYIKSGVLMMTNAFEFAQCKQSVNG